VQRHNRGKDIAPLRETLSQFLRQFFAPFAPLREMLLVVVLCAFAPLRETLWQFFVSLCLGVLVLRQFMP
jgi:hypothetical protein